MNVLESLFSTYPTIDVSCQNFIDALTPGAPGFGMTLATVLVTFLLGFLVYVYSFTLVDREKSGPYPLWMHTFYCAADFMGIWVFLCAWNNYDHFWFFWIFTQVIICCAPGLFWEQRGKRIGACWQLNIVLVLVAIMSFNPWNMWALIAPQFFSVANNPWYYVVGAVTLFFALRGCWVYAKLPKKPELLDDGKKPVW